MRAPQKTTRACARPPARSPPPPPARVFAQAVARAGAPGPRRTALPTRRPAGAPAPACLPPPRRAARALPLLPPRARPRRQRRRGGIASPTAPGETRYPPCCCSCSSWISRNLLTTKDRKICSILVAMTAAPHRHPPRAPLSFLPRREASGIPQATAATRGRGPWLTSALYALSRLAAP